MLAMLLEKRSELFGKHGLFFSGLNPIADDDDGNTGDRAPAVNGQGGSDYGQIESGINGMAEVGVGTAADELVTLFEGDAGAPVLSEMPARPESDGNADPG